MDEKRLINLYKKFMRNRDVFEEMTRMCKDIAEKYQDEPSVLRITQLASKYIYSENEGNYVKNNINGLQ